MTFRTKFLNIAYLKIGNARQQLAYEEIKDLDVFCILREFNPVLTGTIPIAIDLPESDLDIICEAKNLSDFEVLLRKHYGDKKCFKQYRNCIDGIESSITSFKGNHFTVEVFCQDFPVQQQIAYRHLVIEDKILRQKGEAFKEEIISLKKSGLKTEKAFAQLLGLKGNPFKVLLEL
ncbi:DUF4269 domain-containing protein [Ascidiimonas aurantiaca]|uniref:DUF4269 domain-containing protein n=1 Tax=Ascidiimonas aurantiaca TaxID=1685432 RepID=UPI0030EBEDF4